MNPNPNYIITLFLLALLAQGNAQNTSYWDQYTPVSEGLFHYEGEKTFRSFFQDSRGFIWGSDQDYKLIRFDGKEVVSFPNDPRDSTSNCGCDFWPNTVKFLEDKEGHIWMLSNEACVQRYDPVLGKFERIHEQMLKITHDSIDYRFFITQYLMEDHNRDIWIGIEGGLFKYSFDNHALTYFPVWGFVTLIFEDADHNIWIKKEPGQNNHWLQRLDKKTGTFVDQMKLDLPYQVPGNVNRMEGHYYLEASDSILLLADFNLVFFDPRKKEIYNILESPFSKDNFVTSMYAKDGLVLLGTSRGELYHFSPKTGRFQKNQTLFNADLSLSSSLSDVFKSSDGTIWITQRKTPKCFFPKKTFFKKATMPEDIPGFTRDRRYADAILVLNGTVYFQTSRGLFPVRDTVPPLSLPELRIKNVPRPMRKIYNFDNDRQGNLWMVNSTGNKYERNIHIRKYDRSGTLTYRFDGPYLIEGCRWATVAVAHMKTDLKGGLWISPFGQLSYFDPNTSSFVHHFCGSEKGPFKDVRTRSLFVDQDNDLWLGSSTAGLLWFDHQLEQWHSFPLSETGHTEEKMIYSIYQDSKGTFWAGTETGLVKFDKKGGQKQYYSQTELLQALVVEKIFEDHHHNLWVTTGDWLARYDPQRDVFIPFVKKDGVLAANYYNTDVLRDSSGFIFLPGSNYEVAYFHPDSMQLDSLVPDIYFTNLKLFSKPIKSGDTSGILKQSLDHAKKIVLQYAQNDFSIHYAAPSYIHPHQTVYATQLMGFQDDWQEVGTQQQARFTNLSPGNYTFKVKARNHHGYWSDTVRALKITVLPPWYRTWWAYTLWIGLIAGLIYWVYRYQLRRQLALAEAQRLKELDRTKSQLYTNITHEFRTPLTIILGMADQVKNDPKNWFNEGLRLIRRNGKQLLNLVNQLLDLSKLESGHTALKLVNGDIVSYLHYLTESFHSFADSKDIRLHFLSEVKALQMDYDPEKMQNVISNLLSNAIKFTPAGGDVYLIIRFNTLGVLKTPRVLNLIIKDTGLGISSEHLPHIFDRFYQVDGTATRRGEGTGIGLALTKELVKLMGGTIDVESEIDKGTIFTISMPVKQEAQNQGSVTSELETSSVSETILLESEPEVRPQGNVLGNQPLVLLIEDNADVITYLSSFLSGDFQVETATNGQQGIDKAIELIPDLIVSDVMMPEKDGFEVCATLKEDERTSHIPIILLTAKSDTAAKLEGLTQGADAYLAKPFNKEELLVRMEKLIELRKRLQTHYENTSDLLQLSAKSTPSPEDRFLQKLIGIVEDNLENEHFGLPDLCRKAHLSRSQVFRKLKALTGQSTTHFIRSIRLEKGKTLLKTTDLTVAEVAFRVGFSSVPYFSRVFKEVYGVAPSEVGRG